MVQRKGKRKRDGKREWDGELEEWGVMEEGGGKKHCKRERDSRRRELRGKRNGLRKKGKENEGMQKGREVKMERKKGAF